MNHRILLAAKEIDLNDIKHVIKYDCPNSSEVYEYRIRRTTRSEKIGIAYIFFM